MIVLSALAVIVLGACGSVAGGTGTAGHPSPSPSASASASASGSPGASSLTVDDSGHTITAHPGQVISVSLKAPQGYKPWGAPSSSDQTVMAPTVNTGASAQVGWTLAKFKALKDGSVRLDSSTTMSCPPGVACPMLARAWFVTVQVTG